MPILFSQYYNSYITVVEQLNSLLQRTMINMAIPFMLVNIIVSVAAWGHLFQLRKQNNRFFDSFAIKRVVNNQNILCCLHIEDENQYPRNEMEQQVKAAVRVWMTPLSKQSIVEAVFTDQEQCNREGKLSKDTNFDVLVRIAPGNREDAYAFQQPMKRASKHFSLVQINTAFVQPNTNYSNFNYASLLQPDTRNNLKNNLDSISFHQPQTAETVALRYGLSPNRVQFNTYSTLIHEFGHVFGLCDTYKMDKSNCDEKWARPNIGKSVAQPTSVMRDCDWFHLSSDDTAGINELYNRFKRAPKKKPPV